MSEPRKLPQIVAALVVCIGAMATGTAIAWTANITPSLLEGKLNDIEIDEEHLGWVGAMMTLGAMSMGFPVGILCDVIGRKLTMLLTVIPFTVGWALIIFMRSVEFIYVARFLIGMGGGAFCVSAPLYNSEIAHTSIRGLLGTFFQLMVTIGILFCGVFGALLPLLIYDICCASIPIIFAIVFIFMPESPTYLIKKGKPDETIVKAFRKLRGKEYDTSTEIKELTDAIATEKASSGSFWANMKTKPAKKATLICFTLMFYQQLSGINAVIFYTNDIFKIAGSTIDPIVCTIVIQVLQVIATIAASLTIDKFGRKLLLMVSDGFMALSTFVLGIFICLKDRNIIDEAAAKSAGFIPIVSVVVFVIAFSVGFGPIPWLASGELFPAEVKAKCSAAAVTFNWFLAFLVTKFFFNVKQAVGGDILFFIFGGISLSGVFFVLFVMPETKGKSFAEIQEALGK